MNLEIVIQEKVRALPPRKQEKVLAFVEDLESEETKPNGSAKRGKTEEEKHAGRMALAGMFSSGRSDISERAEEILAEGVDKRSGWTVKEKPIAD